MPREDKFAHRQHTKKEDVLKIIDPKGSIYKENKTGPKMDPWGIPEVQGAGEEEESQRKYDL